MKTNIKRLALFLLAPLLIASTLFVAFPQTSSAVTRSTANIDERVKAYLYTVAIARCAEKGTFSNGSNYNLINPENAVAYQWWSTGGITDTSVNKLPIGHYLAPDDGEINCADTDWLKTGLQLLGWSDPIDALCDFGFTRDGQDCRTGTTGWFKEPNNVGQKIKDAVSKKFHGGANATDLSGAMKYMLYLRTYTNGCQASPLGPLQGASSANTTTGNGVNGGIINVVDQQTGVVTETIYRQGIADTGRDITVAISPNGYDRGTNTCAELNKLTNDNAAAYATYVKENGGDDSPEAGAGNAGSDSGAETCNVTGVGWIVCPAATFMADVTDKAYALIENLLVFSFADNALDTNNPVYAIWNNIRNLANVAFIFAFFAIIFSQATSLGIANYGIKKMLPRLVVAAILVNLSYFICVFGIDISNIIGAGIDGIIKSVPLANGGGTSSDPANATGTWTGVITGLLAGGAVVGGVAAAGGIVAALAAALPFLVVALFAIITALVILIARQAILILLIVIAPLAFVAYILPNTEDWFNKWRKLFITLLVFYPLVAILFAGSNVAASVLRLTSNGGGFDDQLIKVMSLAVAAFPLFGLPFILKFSGGVLGRIAGMVNNPNKGPFDRMRKSAEQTRDTTQARAKERALKRARPNYDGRFGKARTKVANTAGGVFTARGVAQKSVDREKGLQEAQQAQSRASSSYFAGRVDSDDAYAEKMAGSYLERDGFRLNREVDRGNLARVRGRASEAIINMNNEEIKAHSLNLNRNGATLAAGGYGMDTGGNVLDSSGNVVDHHVAANSVGIPLSTGEKLDVETQASLKYAYANRLTGTVNGAKAVASTLGATGNLTEAFTRNLVDGLKDVPGVSVEDRAFLVAHINSEAAKAGLKHLQYNVLDADGKINIGGQFGGIDGVVTRIMQNGAASITKEMYADAGFSTKFAQAVTNLEQTRLDTFRSELVKMDPRKIEYLAKAKVKADPSIDEATEIQRLKAMREDAVKEFGIVD